MTKPNRLFIGHTVARSVLIFVAALLFAPAASVASDRSAATPSAEEMVRKLTPAPTPSATRSLTRGISVVPAGPPAPPPSLDLRVNFEAGSSQLTEDASAVLRNLGRALTDPALRASRFLIGGHTDNVGFDWYNNWLSTQRAQSVADFLATQTGVEPSRLVVQGFGRSKPIDTDNPTNPANRRVQIVNLGAGQ